MNTICEDRIHEQQLCGERRDWHGTTVMCTGDKWHPFAHRAMAIDAAGNITTLCTWTDRDVAVYDAVAA